MLARSWLVLVVLIAGCDGPPSPMKADASLVGHSGEIGSIAFSPDGKTLATRSLESVKLWDVPSRKGLASLPIANGVDRGSLAFSPDGKTLAANRGGKGAVVWDVGSRQVRASFDAVTPAERTSGPPIVQGWGLAYSPDGKTLAVGGSVGDNAGFVTLWDVTKKEGLDLESQPGPVASVAFSPDGRALAWKGMSGLITFWDLASKAERQSFAASGSFLAPFAFSPDGLTIASVGEGRTVELWDVASGKSKGRMKEHLKAVLSLAYHPNGRVIASGDADGTIYLWDLSARRARISLVGAQSKVWALAFSPDGSTLAAGGEDKVVRLWDVAKAVEGISKRD